MEIPQPDKTGMHILLKLASLVVILAGIHAAADIIVQLLLALFFAIVLNPLVTWFIRRGVQRPVAITIVVVVMLIALTALVGVLAASFNEFISMLPKFNKELTRKLFKLQEMLPFLNLHMSPERMLQRMDSEKVVTFTTALMTGLSGAMASVLLLVMTVVFMLFEVRHVPYKMRFALNNPQIHIAGLHRALKGVSHYLALKTLLSLWTGVIVWLGLELMGVQFALMWANILITPTSYLLLNIFMLALGALMLFFSGRVWAGDSAPEKREIAVWRQCLFLVPGLLILVGWIIALHLADYQFHQMGSGWLADLMLPWLGVLLVSVVGGEYWWIVIIPVGAHISFSLGYGRPTRHPLTGTSGLRCRNSLLFILLMLGFVAGYQGYLYKQLNPGVGVRENIDTWAWRPDKLNNQLTPLRGKPQIQFTQNWPRLDGATAAYPIYASAFYALSVIPEDFHTREYLESSRTPDAYNRIVKGDADIIFVAQPSGGQKKRAEESGVTLLYTPFAREAFVFIVNADNPVNSLTEQQVRDIFSGAITNWRTVGGNDQEIQTWQRPEDSGSQTVMQSQVMKNVRMISPQETEVASMMEGMIKVVAEYRNTNNAIGYTFRYYATQMNADKNIKLLAINGIAPTAENIRNGKYPYIVDAFMVTRENTTSETQKLLEWFLTPQGQSLVEDVGYVPMYKTLP